MVHIKTPAWLRRILPARDGDPLDTGRQDNSIDMTPAMTSRIKKMKVRAKIENVLENISTPSPRRSHTSTIMFDADTYMKIPPYPMRMVDMYEVANLETIIRTCRLILKKETFRRGDRWEPLWTSKCTQCGREFDTETPYQRCPVCEPEDDSLAERLEQLLLLGKSPDVKEYAELLKVDDGGTTTMVYPDPSEYKKAKEFLDECNLAGQSFNDVRQQIEDDINIVDEAYLVVRKKYLVAENGDVIASQVQEIIRASPIVMRKVVDQYNRVGGIWWRCLGCGSIKKERKWVDMSTSKDRMSTGEEGLVTTPVNQVVVGWEHPVCSCCGRKMHDVIYFGMRHELGDVEQYFVKGEVHHYHYYQQGVAYGMPPILSIYAKAAALIYQDTFIRDYFQHRQAPKGVVHIASSNPVGTIKLWDVIMEKFRKNHQYLPMIPTEIEGGIGGTGGAAYIKLMDTLAEMQYVPARDEMRERITAMYGVSFRFMADTKSGAGSPGNEGTQMVMSNRTTEAKQMFHNRIAHDIITKDLGIKNWRLILNPGEDRDIFKEEQIEQIQLQNNQMLKSLGFEVDKDLNGEWINWKPEMSEQDIGVLERLITEKFQLDAQIEEMKMMPSDNELAQQNSTGGMATSQQTKPAGGGEPNKDKAGTSVMKGEVGDTKTAQSTNGKTNTPISRGAPKSGSTYTPGSQDQYTCNICGKAFASKQALGGHMKGEHGVGGDEAQEMMGSTQEGTEHDIETRQDALTMGIMEFLAKLRARRRPKMLVQKQRKV